MAGYVLVLYFSRNGSTKNLAYAIASGARAEGVDVRVRTVAPIEGTPADTEELICTKEELANCSALALGSPTRFGNMAAALKQFLDQTSDLWLSGALIGKPASVFTSSSSMHGGQESTLLSMMLPLLHQGMLISGVPYNEKALHNTVTGGTPYGVTHVAMPNNSAELSDDELALAKSTGRRLAQLSKQLVVN